MKKIFFLFPLLSVFISCTFTKGEVPKPVQACVADPVIHIVPVAIGDNFFNPASITIIAGDTVKWTYATGSSGHSSTCNGTGGSTLPSGGTTWDSGVLSSGGIYQTALSIPGNYTYICTIHGAAMSGTIIVKPRCQ